MFPKDIVAKYDCKTGRLDFYIDSELYQYWETVRLDEISYIIRDFKDDDYGVWYHMGVKIEINGLYYENMHKKW